MSKILDIKARQVLDSRGNPTVEVDVYTKDFVGTAIDPSGASTGIHEALELRDKTKSYHGKGVTKAIKNVNTKIRKTLLNKKVDEQATIDGILIDLDGTPNKGKLGANAILAVSLACARAAAASQGLALFEYLCKITHKKPLLPVPFANVINGGKHADGALEYQEFMIVPIGAKNFAQAAQMVAETYHELAKILKKKFGPFATHLGDEGGFAPPIKSAKEACDLLVLAIKKAGYTKQIKIAMDAAASEFYNKKNHTYLRTNIRPVSLEKKYLELAKKYPLISLEDPFDQDDFASFKSITKKASKRKHLQIVGDDLTVTNPIYIKRAIEEKLCNTLLLKLNQIGSLTEALRAAKMASDAGWNIMVSHRSGETEDSFIADLTVALACGQIKIGAPARGERTAKYNQLLRIEEYLGSKNNFAKLK